MAQANWQTALAAAKRLGIGRKGVMGVDFGWGYKNGVRKKRLCIRFHVESKLHPLELRPYELLPTTHLGVPCDVLQASYSLHLSPKAPISPLQPGISIGNLNDGSTGTLGAVVRDKHTDRAALLSNWHVLYGGSGGAVGDPICQPGPAHAGSTPARRVATLERCLRLDLGLDAALAILDAGSAFDTRVFELNLTVSGVATPTRGMHLVKMGVTSGVTAGLIDGTDGTYRMNYTNFSDQVRWMDGFHLVRIPGDGPDEISLAGDSGALWIDSATNKAVGLHFGGEDGLGPLAEYAIAHPLMKVLDALDADLWH